MAKLSAGDRGILAIVGGGILLFLLFWGVVAYVALHFIAKFW